MAATSGRRVVVLVSGATSHRAVLTNLDSLAAAMAGFSLVAYDRRGRGDSGDTPPYAPQREVEDLFAVVGASGAQLVHDLLEERPSRRLPR